MCFFYLGLDRVFGGLSRRVTQADGRVEHAEANSHQSTAIHRSTKRMIALLGRVRCMLTIGPTARLTHSLHLLFFHRWRRRRLSRGRRCRSQMEGKVSRWLFEMYRHFLRVGLLLVLDTRPRDNRSHCIWSLYGTVYHVVHCRQHAIHGHGPSRHGSRFWKRSPLRKLCEFNGVFFVHHLVKM